VCLSKKRVTLLKIADAMNVNVKDVFPEKPLTVAKHTSKSR
jgi:hypothetical protein